MQTAMHTEPRHRIFRRFYLTGAKAMVVSADAGDAYGVNAYNGSLVSGDVESIR